MSDKIRSLLATVYHMLFDEYCFEPEKAGEAAGEEAAKKSHGIFDSSSEEPIDKQCSETARKTWLRRFLSSFSSAVKRSLDE